MTGKRFFLSCVLFWMGHAGASDASAVLDLTGYTEPGGAITVLHSGDSADPYFAMQALLLAYDNGMGITAPAEKFVNWLLPRQKPDGTFDRFCRHSVKKWVSCKTADADDSLLALWLRLLDTMPEKMSKNPAWQKSRSIAQASLAHLFQPSRGIYMVSPVVLHGLFMDNLEVWSLKVNGRQPAQRVEAEKLASAIHATFWNPVDKRYLVSTQLEQRSQKPAFYPDHVAQIFPLLVDFPLLPATARQHYRAWMQTHRSEWLAHSKADYPWGVLAVLALRQNDRASASCWLREAAPMRHSARWAVTDETAYQLLVAKGLSAASAGVNCK
ncbi:hypothetical protein [Polaromonas eurypsychrophila]|uniref:Uncharacterized protein n=1 Tax=Polaromonas eurypsychrophila TaxID=1614635 RepID=A0A916WM41_9BURK|nr:hypothetical protein [Polaromonas eurypsychrophila]GGB10774.1 hypothetical protein GCM10011496_34640 [Polaromonas eurypsychrophila]